MRTVGAQFVTRTKLNRSQSRYATVKGEKGKSSSTAEIYFIKMQKKISNMSLFITGLFGNAIINFIAINWWWREQRVGIIFSELACLGHHCLYGVYYIM